MVIDAHHHFWHYDPVAYDWIDDRMQAIRRDFLPGDLQAAMAGAGVDGVVSVQARQTLAETEWLLQLADAHPFIRGVVGWVDLRSPALERELARLAPRSKLKAVRHVVQAEPDDFLLRPDFNRGIGCLRRFGLAYDLLVFARHLPQVIRFVDAHPDQVFVLDHLAKPPIRSGELAAWRRDLHELARRPQVYCKLSGLVTEADYATWTEAQLRPCFDTALAAFGPRRLMFGSDWPVCLVACDYARWRHMVASWLDELTESERRRILGGTAVEAYRL